MSEKTDCIRTFHEKVSDISQNCCFFLTNRDLPSCCHNNMVEEVETRVYRNSREYYLSGKNPDICLTQFIRIRIFGITIL